MSWFANKQKPGHTALPQAKHAVHKESRKVNPADQKQPFVHPIHMKAQSRLAHQQVKSRSATPKGSKPASPLLAPSPKEKPLAGRKRPSSTPPRQDWGDDDEGSDLDLDAEDTRKRQKRESTIEADPGRTIWSPTAFSSQDDGKFAMIHGADLARCPKVGNAEYTLAFPSFEDFKIVELQYPSASQKERYELVMPNLDDDFKPLVEIREVMEMTIAHYLPPAEAKKLGDDSHGLPRNLKRAAKELDGKKFGTHVQTWNETLNRLRNDGTLQSRIKEWRTVDVGLCEFILTQTYARTVSLGVKDLRKYETGGNNVYGELLPRFVSEILTRDVKIKADQLFVDLGSGVGNVVLQAALEVGCESWGCEEVPSACKLADKQKTEFEARCRLWGLSAGAIHLEQGDFLTNSVIHKALQKADVVLVNNQAFTPDLNDKLTHLFLDLKDGAKVVSLKSFAPVGHQQHARNAGAIYNILDVLEKRYYDRSVSWTNASGTYYVATKDSSRMNG